MFSSSDDLATAAAARSAVAEQRSVGISIGFRSKLVGVSSDPAFKIVRAFCDVWRAMPVILNCEYQDAIFKDERVVPVYLGGERVTPVPQSPCWVCYLLRAEWVAPTSHVLDPLHSICIFICVFLMLFISSSPYWGLTLRSPGAGVVACVLFPGFPGFSAGRGFDPAGGAPGGG
ncbi:hypothetical protein F511_36308 [Dorcoceras hygrometricum]|uniref:Uncharacterized protein n=1 Tax=Dorcoceras hygrometricum TaxID=472368 RepID=A0A2Z7ARW3_9LAMI|nr:hypothetical protein F511_36308 [Dorcoceras hygrometricum]